MGTLYCIEDACRDYYTLKGALSLRVGTGGKMELDLQVTIEELGQVEKESFLELTQAMQLN